MKKKLSKIFKEIKIFERKILKSKKAILTLQEDFINEYDRINQTLKNNLSECDYEVIRYYFNENISTETNKTKLFNSLLKFKEFIYFYSN